MDFTIKCLTYTYVPSFGVVTFGVITFGLDYTYHVVRTLGLLRLGLTTHNTWDLYTVTCLTTHHNTTMKLTNKFGVVRFGVP